MDVRVEPMALVLFTLLLGACGHGPGGAADSELGTSNTSASSTDTGHVGAETGAVPETSSAESPTSSLTSSADDADTASSGATSLDTSASSGFGSSDSSNPTSAATSEATSSGSTGAGDDATSTGAEIDVSVPFCRPPCLLPNDCAGQPPLYDAPNWACVDAGCVWLGCLDDGECALDQRCVALDDTGGGILQFCVASCVTSDDCGSGSGPYIAENYDCIDGACIFNGCGSDEECEAVSSGLGCFPRDADVCLQTCVDSSDCGSGAAAWDADNYECIDGACIYLGCLGDSECDGDAVCVAA